MRNKKTTRLLLQSGSLLLMFCGGGTITCALWLWSRIAGMLFLGFALCAVGILLDLLVPLHGGGDK